MAFRLGFLHTKWWNTCTTVAVLLLWAAFVCFMCYAIGSWLPGAT